MTNPDLPKAHVKSASVSSGRRIPAVWIIPLIALLIGGWLVVKTIAERGPAITISFETAEGLNAGKTEIRYRDVKVGTVTGITLDPALDGVVATAEMVAGVDDYLTENTQFWVVRPRFGVKEISGLGTLVAGAYVEVDPGEIGGEAKREFIGLELPPAIRTDAPGKEFILVTQDLGALSRGSPVYHKGIDVGEVLGYKLDKNDQDIQVRIFINEPYADLVRNTSRFWNVSGFQATLGADGVELATSSLQSLILGGVNFDTPTRLNSMEKAPELTKFPLFKDQKHIEEAQITEKHPAIMYFEETLRGLKPGAPVEFRGVRIGTVKDYRLEFDSGSLDYRMPVLIEFEPQRMARYSEDGDRPSDDEQRLEKLIAVGLRARLETDSFLTGAKFIEFDFLPDTDASFYGTGGNVVEIPTVPSNFNQIASSATELLQKLTKAVDGAQKVTNAPELLDAVKNLNRTMVAVERFTRNLNTSIAPEAQATLTEAHKTLATLRKAVDEQSPLRYDMETMMRELSAAARSVRNVANYLERNPSALITGKKGSGQ